MKTKLEEFDFFIIASITSRSVKSYFLRSNPTRLLLSHLFLSAVGKRPPGGYAFVSASAPESAFPTGRDFERLPVFIAYITRHLNEAEPLTSALRSLDRAICLPNY